MRYSFASRAEWMLSSPREMARVHSRHDSLITLAEELPAEELFPLSSLQAAAMAVISSDGKALQYGELDGYIPLREWVAEWMRGKGVHTQLEQLLLTTGTQQAMDLVARVYVDAGDPVLVQSPSSPGWLQILKMQGAHIVPVEGDGDGISIELLRQALQTYHPKLLIVSPNFSNPTGVLWSMERRQQVLELCRQHDVLIVEDDSYGDLCFKNKGRSFLEKYSSLYALDGGDENGQVLYVGSFSKTVAPALRTGWAAGSSKLIQVMAQAKQLADWQSSTLNQRMLHYLLDSTSFNLQEHIKVLNREYEVRLQLMLELLRRPRWRGVSYNVPEGGMFLWIKLPEGLDCRALLKAARKKGVIFLPGTLCYVYQNSGGVDHIRLNFTHPGRDELLLGMNLINEAIQEFQARN